jgi:hypothetical protein
MIVERAVSHLLILAREAFRPAHIDILYERRNLPVQNVYRRERYGKEAS